MDDKRTDDAIEWGMGVYVYCEAHRGPHVTGWCTVGVRAKIRLDATSFEDAVSECRGKNLDLWEVAVPVSAYKAMK